MTARVTTDADPVASRVLEEALICEMAAHLTAANVDLGRVDLCRAALIEARYPTGAIDRLIDDARQNARQSGDEAA